MRESALALAFSGTVTPASLWQWQSQLDLACKSHSPIPDSRSVGRLGLSRSRFRTGVEFISPPLRHLLPPSPPPVSSFSFYIFYRCCGLIHTDPSLCRLFSAPFFSVCLSGYSFGFCSRTKASFPLPIPLALHRCLSFQFPHPLSFLLPAWL